MGRFWRWWGPVVPPPRSEIAADADFHAPTDHAGVAKLRFDGADAILEEIEAALSGSGRPGEGLPLD